MDKIQGYFIDGTATILAVFAWISPKTIFEWLDLERINTALDIMVKLGTFAAVIMLVMLRYRKWKKKSKGK